MPARAKSLAFARAVAGLIRLDFASPLRRLSWTTLLVALAAPGGALAQAQCAPTTQPPTLCSSQVSLLSPFASLLNSPAGLAVLEANMQTEEAIYAGASAARRTLAAENALIAYAPQSILIGAFPNNSNFYFSAAGVATAPTLPTPVTAAVTSVTNNMATGATTGDLKNYFGQIDVYGVAYNAATADPNGDPRPFQTSNAIANNPFTPANSSLIAYQIQQTNDGYQQNWQSYVQSPSFPSGHSAIGNVNAIEFAILAPGYFQQFLQSGVDFGYSRNVFAAHYPLDVIGGRILATYVTAETLAGDNPLYQTAGFNQANLASLSGSLQGYLTTQAGLGDGGASPYAAACANLADCLGNGTIPTAATYAQATQNYAYYLTYDLPAVGPTNLAPVVPADAHVLIETRFPYLSVAQLDDILATTELPSGGALDNGSGWARLNLYAAAGGYGAFPSDVTVYMDSAAGGFNAFDVWSNAISGPGGLTKQGSGTLVLAGDDTFTGGVKVQGGALGVTGSLLGPLSVSPGAAFVLGDTGVFTGAVTNNGGVDNEGVMTGTFAGSGTFANSGFLSGVGGFGSLDLRAGSTLALGNSIGAIQVAGDLTVEAGAAYQVKIAGNSSDQIEVGGTATLSGGAIVASVLGGGAELGHAYPILVANGGVYHAFDYVSVDNLPFLKASLTCYACDTGAAGDVYLTLARNGVSYASVATTPNQLAVANAVAAGPAGSGLDLTLDVQSATAAQRAFGSLSGEVYASAETAMLNDSVYLRETLLARMRQASVAGAFGPTAALASGGPTTTAYADDLGSSSAASALADTGGGRLTISPGAPPAAVPAIYSWIQAIDSWGRLGGDGDAATASRSLGGFFAGVDRRFDSNWLAGVAGGYTSSSVSVSDRGSEADIGAAHLAGYVTASYGRWNLRSAAAASFSVLDSTRSLAFPGFAERASARFDAATAQIFSEASYSMTLGGIAAEPFGRLAFAHLNVDGFAENGGGVAALSGSSNDLDIGYSTLGGRAAVDCLVANGMVLTPRVSIAWQHAFGSLTPTETFTFQSTGETFAVAGLPTARDTALFDGGLDFRLSPRAEVGLSYSGQYGDRVTSNALKGNLTWLF
jgi:outer membrane autotransporter protein